MSRAEKTSQVWKVTREESPLYLAELGRQILQSVTSPQGDLSLLAYL